MTLQREGRERDLYVSSDHSDQIHYFKRTSQSSGNKQTPAAVLKSRNLWSNSKSTETLWVVKFLAQSRHFDLLLLYRPQTHNGGTSLHSAEERQEGNLTRAL